MIRKNIIWESLDEIGQESLLIAEDDSNIITESVVLGVYEELPYRIWYNINCDKNWRVREVTVKSMGRDSKKMNLISDGKGNWNIDGKIAENLKGCYDIDISVTPFTNTIPIRRMNLEKGESHKINVIYIDAINFMIRPVIQCYTYLSEKNNVHKYLYENLSSGFTSEIYVDDNGFIIEYPELYKRVF